MEKVLTQGLQVFRDESLCFQTVHDAHQGSGGLAHLMKPNKSGSNTFDDCSFLTVSKKKKKNKLTHEQGSSLPQCNVEWSRHRCHGGDKKK